jgi:hypothetical protein
MEPIGSVDHSEDRNLVTGVAFVQMGHRISPTEAQPPAMPDTDQEPTRQTSHDHLGSSKAIDNETTHSETTRTRRDPKSINHAASTKVRTLPTDVLVRHTHLQRVAFGLLVYRFGGGGC